LKSTVLIADNNKTLVMYLGILLKRMGFETITARDGYEAVRLIEVCRPDILMADAGLPQFDALKALGEFGGDPDGYRPSVIMLVGAADGHTEERGRMLGTCVQLKKPVDTAHLHEAIQDCMFKPLGTKRRHMRAKVEMSLNVGGSGGERDLKALTLSAGGAFVVTDDPPPVGEIMNIVLPCSDELCLFVTGRVIYTRAGGSGALSSSNEPGFAVEFMDLSEEDRDALDVFVSGLVTEGITQEAPAKSAGSIGVYGALMSYASPPRDA